MKKLKVVVLFKDNRSLVEKRFASFIEMKLQVEVAKFLATLNFSEVAKVELIPEND